MPLSNLFTHKSKEGESNLTDVPIASGVNLPEDQRMQLEQDVSMLADKDGTRTMKLQADAEKQVRTSVEESIKQLRVVELGRCPVCGSHIHQHPGANICDACGWNQFDRPKYGKVRVHLKGEEGIVEGERAYVLKDGDCLVVHNGVVIAKVPHAAYSWVEYAWPQEELKLRQQLAERTLTVSCGWCGKETNPTEDGFHLVHVAFGSSQERYCFCCDECYEAFRKMYPARVHRNCYERECKDCDLCLKRYDDDATEMRMLTKDYIQAKK